MKKEYESYTVFELDGEYESFNVGGEFSEFAIDCYKKLI